jgi:DNA-directed RNA polymerase specialized sigma24 family protein
VSRLSRSAEVTSTAPEYASDLADLLRLAPEARAVLWLVEVEDHTYATAGAVLGITEEAARTRAARARQQLRLHLLKEEKEQ